MKHRITVEAKRTTKDDNGTGSSKKRQGRKQKGNGKKERGDNFLGKTYEEMHRGIERE